MVGAGAGSEELSAATCSAPKRKKANLIIGIVESSIAMAMLIHDHEEATCTMQATNPFCESGWNDFSFASEPVYDHISISNYIEHNTAALPDA